MRPAPQYQYYKSGLAECWPYIVAVSPTYGRLGTEAASPRPIGSLSIYSLFSLVVWDDFFDVARKDLAFIMDLSSFIN